MGFEMKTSRKVEYSLVAVVLILIVCIVLYAQFIMLTTG